MNSRIDTLLRALKEDDRYVKASQQFKPELADNIDFQEKKKLINNLVTYSATQLKNALL